jgi:hypothetical protein
MLASGVEAATEGVVQLVRSTIRERAPSEARKPMPTTLTATRDLIEAR